MNIKFIAIPAIALAAGIGLAACGSGSGGPQYTAPEAPGQGTNGGQGVYTAPSDAPDAAPPASSAPTTSDPAPAQQKTLTQVCQSAIGNNVINTTTGQKTELTVESTTYEGHGGGAAGAAVEGAGVATVNHLVQCWATYSDGTAHQIEVTLFPNGSTGWHADN